MTTVLDKLAEAARAAATYNPNAQAAPSCVLWPDGGRQFEAVLPQLRGALPELPVAILEGKNPYDIFVRWKDLAHQPVGWNPDPDDGMRLNIRPFCEPGVLREPAKKLNIKWEKDRGSDLPTAPWYPVFHGDRINDHHLSLAEKKDAIGNV